MKRVIVPAKGVPEEWKHVEGFPRLMVSNLGRVKTDSPRGKPHPGRWLKTRYRITFNGVHLTVGVLVLEAFVAPRPSPDHRVWYENGYRKDNRASNLSWIHKDLFVKKPRNQSRKLFPDG